MDWLYKLIAHSSDVVILAVGVVRPPVSPLLLP